MSESYAPIVMFAALFGMILINLPVAFALFVTSMVFGVVYWGWGGLYVVFQGIWTLMNNWALVSLPLFVFMSAILEKSGVAEELFTTLYDLFGKVRGSLAIVAVLFGYLIGAMSGVIAAAVSAMALILFPVMEKNRYDRRLSIGSLLAAGCLPQVVPPSFNMIVYGSVAGVSVGKLFAGGLGVGLVMALVFIAYIWVYSTLNKDRVPVIAEEIPLREKMASLRFIVGPFLIIIGVLGSIFSGMATPTEASGVGAFLSLSYVALRRRLKGDVLKDSLLVTLKVTSMACWIMAAGSAFSSVFSGIGGRALMVGFLTSMPAAKFSVLAFSMAIIFVLGMFIDPVSIIMIMTPILTPAVVELGYDPIWWGIVFCSLLLLSYITPPVGLGLYYFKGVAQDVPMDEICKSVLPFVILMFLAVVIIVLFPDSAMWFVRNLGRS
ncbi:TRAP transporter, DctM subunit [Thermanaerovibrio velox DSM 12556]|uniref:TRAP transporter, DctM subunit n=1 Tax=Thermanaerovibrio velox DSM 12556 TaxID=926567 RepID=H0UP52_9BACT|nr:TRAP transporter large permease subunit [Thermanaerovibrio velox]EHM09465.1 TRAP transporter, DctM subunit [Thermanaerovibrio velox DSM 12556]